MFYIKSVQVYVGLHALYYSSNRESYFSSIPQSFYLFPHLLYHSFFAISSLYSDNQHNFSMTHSPIHIKKYHGSITISDESIIIWAFG